MFTTLITYTLYALTALIPLVFTTWNYELFEFPKFIILLAGSLFIFILMLGDQILSHKKSFILLWQKSTNLQKLLHTSVLAILTTQALATIFSVQVNTSLWGYYSRFHQGLITTLCYTIIYFAVALYLNKKTTHNLIKISVTTSILVSIYGIMEHFGIDKNLWVQDVQNRVFSTLGQPNWLAAYLLPHLFLVLYIDYIKEHHKQNNTLLTYLLFGIIFVTLLYTKSRSGLIAFGLSTIMYWAVMIRNFGWADIRSRFASTSIICIVAIIVIGTPFGSLKLSSQTPTPPPTTTVGPAMETGGTESGEIRKIVWTGALELVKKRPILGFGPETFAYTYFQVRPVAHNFVSEWDFLYNKAHNEYLNIAACTGLVGLAGYLFFHLMVTILGIQKNTFAPVLLATIASFAITNFFGFSVIPVYLVVTIIAGLSNTISTNESKNQEKSPNYLILLIASMSLIIPYRLYLADVDYAKGKALADQHKYAQAIPLLESAHKSFPNFDLYLTTLSESYAGSGQIEQAISTSQDMLVQNPIHQNNLKSAAKVALTLATTDPKYYSLAAYDLEAAASLAPTDPKVLYNLALVYTRLGNHTKAIDALNKSINLRRTYAEPYYALTLVYEETKQNDLIPPLLVKAQENLATYSAQLKAKIDEYLR